MMSPFKLLIPAVFFPCIVSAQQPSGYLLDNASTIDELKPTFLRPAFGDLSFAELLNNDSSLYVRTDPKRGLKISSTQVTGQTDTARVSYSFHWNQQGRLESFTESSAAGTAGCFYTYQYGKLLRSQIITSKDSSDTITLGYNRSGQLVEERLSHHMPTADSVTMITKLYNSKGQLIAVRGCAYGPGANVYGDFVYDYHDDGRLARRRFLAGPALCTDTLVYTYDDSLKTILRTRHLFRITGTEKWILIDQQVFDIPHERQIEYAYFNGGRTHPFYNLSAGNFISRKYGFTGRIVEETISDTSRSHISTSRFYYNDSGSCDSVITTVSASNGKKTETWKIRKTFITWIPGTDLPAAIRQEQYELRGKSRKKKWERISMEIAELTWK
jgi:hypothetical protein